MPPNINVDVQCPICKKAIMFIVDGGNFVNSKEFPIRFQYKHGSPIHNAIVTLNEQFQIIDVNFTQLIQGKRPKKALVDDFVQNFQPKSFEDIGNAIKQLVEDLPQVYQNRPQDQDDKYYEFGFELASNSIGRFSGTSEVKIVEEIAKAYEAANIGKILNIQGEENITLFHISDLYENSKKLDAGRCLYHISEGFVRNILQRKFNKSYLVKSSYDKVHRACELEIQCQWSDFAEKLRKKFAKS
jgi:hypothetical protein